MNLQPTSRTQTVRPNSATRGLAPGLAHSPARRRLGALRRAGLLFIFAAALLALFGGRAAPALAQSCSCSAGGSASCEEEKVEIGFTGSVCSSSGYSLTLNGVTASGSGSCTASTWVTTNKAQVELTVDKPYQLVAGSDSCSTHVVFDVPKKYRLEVNGVATKTIDKGGAEKGSGDGTWEIVVRKCDQCEQNEGIESCDAGLGSINWSVSLGKLSDGRSAQALSIREDFLSPLIFTPAALTYTPPRSPEIDVVRAQDGSIRQIKVPRALADVGVVSASEFEVRFFDPANVGAKSGGLYTYTGQPFVTWRIKNPDPSTLTRLQLSEIQGSVTTTLDYTWDAVTGAWTLNEGGGARVETKTTIPLTDTSRAEVITVKDAAGQLVSKVANTIHSFPWGDEVLESVLDPEGAALKTVYTYYENPAQPGRYRKLQSVAFPTGAWEKYDYDASGNVTLVLRPWKDLALSAATEANSYATVNTYSNSDGVQVSPYSYLVSAVTEKIAGTVFRKTTYARTGTQINGEPATVETETVYYAASAALTSSVTTYHPTASAHLAGKTAARVSHDGTKETFTYEKGDFAPNPDPALGLFTPNPNGAAWRETRVNGTAAAPAGVAFKTTKETSIRDARGHAVLRETYVYNGASYERAGWTAMDYDGRGNLTQARGHNGEVSSSVWAGDRMTSTTNSSGVETAYTYDSLGRVKTETTKGVAASGPYPAQPDIVVTFTYDAEDRVTAKTMTGGGFGLSKSTSYDAAGRVKSETNSAGITTTHAYANGGRTHTVNYAGGTTETYDAYLDGQLKSVTGTAVLARSYDYGVNPDGTRFMQEFQGGGGLSSPRWTKTTTDWLGRVVRVEVPGFAAAATLVRTNVFNNRGQLAASTISSGANKLVADTVSEYDELGREVRRGLDVDASGTLTPLSADRFVENDYFFTQQGADWFDNLVTATYLADNSDAKTDVRARRKRLNNFPAGAGGVRTVSEVSLTNEVGQSTTVAAAVDRAAKKVTVTTDVPESNVDSVSVSLNGLVQSSTATTPETPTTYVYDGLGRLRGTTDPRRGATSAAYHATTGQLVSESDAAQTTTFDYYPATHENAGRLKSKTDAKGKKTFFGYNPRGDLIRTWGDAAYPVENVYDDYGQQTESRTFRGGRNWGADVWPAATAGAADATRWIYHEPSGLLERRRDAAGKDVVYGYDAQGRVTSRAWARADSFGNPVNTSYTYDPVTGDLTAVDYSDSTPDVTFGYDRGARTRSITDAAGTRSRTFNERGDLKAELIAGGILDLVQLNIPYDAFQRRQSAGAARGAQLLVSQTYGYDAASRLETVTSGAQTATYSYQPATGLLGTTTYSGGTTLGRGYDTLGRLQSITTTPAAAPAESHTYTYNNLHQRTRATREDGGYWAYDYNDRGELVAGKKFWSDNTPVFGRQTEYAFDNVGNRTTERAGGNPAGALRQSAYTSNALNQYLQRGVPGVLDVTGTANPAATVSVNNQPAVRRGDYFYKELAVDNSAAPVYAAVNVVGARNNFGAGGEDAVTEKGGRAFVPQAVESYGYDADGNLTADGRWSYAWDAENRLVSMEARPNVPAEARLRLEFAYDFSGRRIEKKVSAWNAAAGGYQLQAVSRFVYDGWNLMAELDGAGALVRSYVWGRDVSGTLDEAGGVGGLLLVNQGGQSYQAGYDGGGNLTALVNAATGAVAASYEYDPYGNTLKAVGEVAAANPFRFSTKYADAETGLSYYGYRYYQPQTGRWLSRDPMGEDGGVNLYAFVGNDPVGKADPFGLYEIDVHYYLTYFLARQVGCFSADEAKAVADGNQGADDDSRYAPAQGAWHHHSIRLDEIGEDQRRRHEEYHALTNPRNHPRNLERLLNEAQLPKCSQRQERARVMRDKLMAFGRYLHYVQDMFSHQDYPDPWLGHGVEFLRGRPNMPDKTFGEGRRPVIMTRRISRYLPPITTVNWDRRYDRVARAQQMVRKTWEEMKDYGRKNKCCDPKDDNLNNTWHWIMEFLQAYAGEDNQGIQDLPDVLKAKVGKLRNMPWSQ